jgi:DUF4097 and DUF4098 domain-containing protein YvlB
VRRSPIPLLPALCTILTVLGAAESKKEFRYTVGAAATFSLVNNSGNVVIRPGTGRQLAVTATLQSDKVEVDGRQSGNRVEIRTHVLQKSSGNEGRVDYEVVVPADTNVTVDSADGRIRVENLHGDVNVDSESGDIELREITSPSIQAQTVNGTITLENIREARVQLTSVGGNIDLKTVTGPLVSAKSTSGSIRYNGNFAGGGRYILANHSGEIEVTMPATASVDVNARSVKGTLENDFPFKKADHPPFPLAEGRSFAGVANNGAASLELRSFSGKIRVMKQ